MNPGDDTGPGPAVARIAIAILGADAAACAALGSSLAPLRPALSITIMVAASGADLPDPAADLTLLCAQDSPDPAELQLRAALAQAGTAYQVLYGPPPAQLRNALEAIDLIAACPYETWATGHFDQNNPGLNQPDPNPPGYARLRARGCEECVQPQCEHRLFTALRGLAAGG